MSWLRGAGCLGGLVLRALTMVSLKLTVTPAQAGKALQVAEIDRGSGNRGADAYFGERRGA
jgi:hypothetical protein